MKLTHITQLKLSHEIILGIFVGLALIGAGVFLKYNIDAHRYDGWTLFTSANKNFTLELPPNWSVHYDHTIYQSGPCKGELTEVFSPHTLEMDMQYFENACQPNAKFYFYTTNIQDVSIKGQSLIELIGYDCAINGADPKNYDCSKGKYYYAMIVPNGQYKLNTFNYVSADISLAQRRMHIQLASLNTGGMTKAIGQSDQAEMQAAIQILDSIQFQN